GGPADGMDDGRALVGGQIEVCEDGVRIAHQFGEKFSVDHRAADKVADAWSRHARPRLLWNTRPALRRMRNCAIHRSSPLLLGYRGVAKGASIVADAREIRKAPRGGSV